MNLSILMIIIYIPVIINMNLKDSNKQLILFKISYFALVFLVLFVFYGRGIIY